MRKLKNKRKFWLILRNKTKMKKLRRKNKRKHSNRNTGSNHNPTITKKTHLLTAPKNFSIINNQLETLLFFNNINNTIKSTRLYDKIFFNLSLVENITIDSIMYLIAIIKNTKRLTLLKVKCSGNTPLNNKAKEILENSGFYNYLTPNYKVEFNQNEKITITSGKEAVPALAGDICTYVQKRHNLTYLHTKDLYPMILELMTNTKQHAYNNDDDEITNNWYVFAEDRNNYIQFVFLDTGEGIPNTIRTNFLEKIKDKLMNSDAYFIASAFKGELRSETNLPHRGKGLPEIYSRIKNGRISNFTVVSGKGMCNITEENAIQEIKLDFELKGSLFYWKIYKQ